jgi:hypothetical protein
MSTTAFKIYFFAISLTLFSSCEEERTIKVVASTNANNRLLEIKKVKRIVSNQRFPTFDLYSDPVYEINIKNISGFDLYHHYYKDSPTGVSDCHYLHYPDTSTPVLMEDTCRIIKKNEEFVIRIRFYPNSESLYQYEYHGCTFQLLISATKDLSPYFENIPSQFKFRKIIRDDGRGNKEFGYPLEFIYWTSCGFFLEQYLVE